MGYWKYLVLSHRVAHKKPTQSGGAANGFPASNLRTFDLGRRWRAAAGANVDWDRGSHTRAAINCAMIARHNLKAKNRSFDLSSGASSGPSGQNLIPAQVPPSNEPFLVKFGDDTQRYLRFHVAGDCEIGFLTIGECFEFEDDQLGPPIGGYATQTPSEVGDTGAVFVTGQGDGGRTVTAEWVRVPYATGQRIALLFGRKYHDAQEGAHDGMGGASCPIAVADDSGGAVYGYGTVSVTPYGSLLTRVTATLQEMPLGEITP